MEMEYLKTPLTRSIGETNNVINTVRSVTPSHTARTKRIKPIRIAANPVVPVKIMAMMPPVPVDRANKSFLTE